MSDNIKIIDQQKIPKTAGFKKFLFRLTGSFKRLLKSASGTVLKYYYFNPIGNGVKILGTGNSNFDSLNIYETSDIGEADILIIQGDIPKPLLRECVNLYERMKEPKFTIIIGLEIERKSDLSLSYNIIRRMDKYIPADLYCEDKFGDLEVIRTLLIELREGIRENRFQGWERYCESFEYYRTNQQNILGLRSEWAETDEKYIKRAVEKSEESEDNDNNEKRADDSIFKED